MTERDPFQNIIENMADDIEDEKDVEPDKYNPEAVGCGARLTDLALGFAQALASLLVWSLLLAVGIVVISENLYDAGVTTIEIAFGEAFWVAVGTIVGATAIRQGSS